MQMVDTSPQLSERAAKVLARPHSNFPGFQNIAPQFFTRAEGARLWDVDGNEYIDYIGGLGPGILGYRNEEYLQDLKDQLEGVYYLAHARHIPADVELAEKIVHHVPSAEKVRYAVTGTEAVQLAIRLARAYTKRRSFIRFEGHYHGWLDNVLGGVVDDAPEGKPYALESIDDLLTSEGKAPSSLQESFKLPWNDIEILEAVLEKYGKEVALILMEPILCNAGSCPPRPGYLERVRELCDEYGILLGFDEIITGFRVGLSGAQGLYGVTPDLTTLGKAIAGGLPFAAVVGKREIMKLLEEYRVMGGGTFNGYPLGVAAALATIKILEKDDGAIYTRIKSIQQRLMDGLKEIGKEHGVPLLLQGPTGVFFCQFVDREVAYSLRDWADSDQKKQERFRQGLFENRVFIMMRGRWYLSASHTERDVDQTLEAANAVMSSLHDLKGNY